MFFKTLEDDHYFLTNFIYDNTTCTVFFDRWLSCLQHNAFALLSCIWIYNLYLYLPINFFFCAQPAILDLLLQTPGRNFFSHDRFNIRMEAFKSNTEICFVVLLFFASKNMTFSQKRFISGQKSTSAFYKNSHFM